MPEPKHIELRDGGESLRLHFPDGSYSDYLAFWLFDNSVENRLASGQRLVSVFDVPEDLRILNGEIAGDSLRLVWSHQAESTTLPLAFLDVYRVPTTPTLHTRPKLRLWDASMTSQLPRYTYPDILNSLEARKQWLRGFATYGIAFLTDVPCEDGKVLEVASLMGTIRETNYGRLFDVKSKTNPNNLAYSDRALGLHTDNPYREPVPAIQLLHCLMASGEGGESTFTDGFMAAELWKHQNPNGYQLLTTTPVRFAYQEQDRLYEAVRPLIQVDAEDNCVAVAFNERSLAPLHLPFDTLQAFYSAYRSWVALLHSETLLYQTRLAPGELVAFQNNRLLHGRTAFTNNPTAPPRHLQGCYLESDGLFAQVT